MKTTSLYFFALSILFFTANTDLLAQKKVKDKVLAGKVFIVELTETTGKKVIKTVTEEIAFKSEKLSSKTMTSQNRFPAGLYIVSDVDSSSTPPVISFTSESTNPDGEMVNWEGTVSGEEIEGSAVITKKGKTKKEYAYTGTLKVKGAPKK